MTRSPHPNESNEQLSDGVLPRELEGFSTNFFRELEPASLQTSEERFHLGHQMLALRSQEEGHRSNDSQPHLPGNTTRFLVVEDHDWVLEMGSERDNFALTVAQLCAQCFEERLVANSPAPTVSQERDRSIRPLQVERGLSGRALG